MGILKRIIGGESAKSISVPFASSIYGGFSNNGGMGFFKKKSYLEEYKNWPYACITARAEAVGDIQLKLIRSGKEIDSHESLAVLRKPNPYMTTHDLLQATQTFKDLDGNAFWYLARENGKGRIREIYIMRPDKVLIVPSKENPLAVAGYVYVQNDGQRIPFEPNQVLHHKNFNPLGNHPFPHRGMSVMEASHMAVDTDNEARTWNYNFFRNSAKPDGVLQYSGDGTLSSDDYLRIKEQWNQTHQGSENAHRTAILSGGIEWKELTRTQKDMEFTVQRTFSRDEILALFRTPKTIVGITDDVNRANAEASIYIYNLRTVKPLMQHLVDTLNEFYLPEWEQGLSFAFVSPVPEDRVSVIAAYTAALAGGWMSRNEVRMREGLPLTPEGDTIYGLTSQVPQDTAPKPEMQKASPEPVAKKQKMTKAQEEALKTVEKFAAKMPLSKERGMTDEQRKAYVSSWKSRFESETKPLEKKLVSYFAKQQKETLANLGRELKGLEKADLRLKDIADIPFDMEEAVNAGISLITPSLKEYLAKAGADAMRLVGQGAFADDTDAIAKFVSDRAKLFSESVNETTRDKVIQAVRAGIADSQSVSDIADAVSTVFEEAKASRTVMIARTELSASSNFGASQAYLQAGVEKQEWTVVDPEDEDCLQNDGAIVKIGDAFPDGSIQPPDPHPNCMCALLPVF